MNVGFDKAKVRELLDSMGLGEVRSEPAPVPSGSSASPASGGQNMTDLGMASPKVLNLPGLPTVAEIRETLAQIEAYRQVVEEYRKVQALQFTVVQHRVLGALTQDKLVDASLRDIVQSLKGLKEMEHLVEGKPTEIKGLVGILMELDSEDVKDLRSGGGSAVAPDQHPLSFGSEGPVVDISPGGAVASSRSAGQSADRIFEEMDQIHCPASTEIDHERMPRL